jgi:hypothetical protein
MYSFPAPSRALGTHIETNQQMRISCLHTAESNIAVFNVAARELQIEPDVLHHVVRADLLAAAESAGGLTSDIADRTRAALLSLAGGADAVVLTCSTLGPAVDGIDAASGGPIMRADAALATTAAQYVGKIMVLCAVETTLGPTSALFSHAVRHSQATVEVKLVSDAWLLFKAGELEGYLAKIADAADQAYADGASIVVLAQASMSKAVGLVSKGPRPLDSATAGITAALGIASLRRAE